MNSVLRSFLTAFVVFCCGIALAVDRDGDVMDDRWSAIHGITDPDGDKDGDSYSNIREFLYGAEPNDDG